MILFLFIRFLAVLPLALVVLGGYRSYAGEIGGDLIVRAVITPQTETYAERHRATYRLSKNLSADDVAVLLRFLGKQTAEDSVRDSELRTLKNNVADALIGQNKPEPGLVDSFISLASDSAQDAAWREYILQKLPELGLRFNAPEIRNRVADFLREKTESLEYIFAGTAIISLQRLGTQDPGLVGPVEIAHRSTVILDEPRQTTASKLAALQVLSASDKEAGVERAKRVLQDDTKPIMLKVSALATLGEMGDRQDLPMLKRYEQSPDYRLRTAARAGLLKIEKRTGS